LAFHNDWLPPPQHENNKRDQDFDYSRHYLYDMAQDKQDFPRSRHIGPQDNSDSWLPFFIHPHITHHVSLKGILHKAIMDVKLTKEEVEEIDPNAL